MIWQSDYSFEELGYEDDGIVAILACSSCDTMAEYSLKEENDELRDDAYSLGK
tara:strand:- start:8265 stop:8423 length:159 start_codon:yes stop_codon:yes gene_type:complete